MITLPWITKEQQILQVCSQHQAVIFTALHFFPSSRCSLKFKGLCRTLDDEWGFLTIIGQAKGLPLTALPLLHGQLLIDKLFIISHQDVTHHSGTF